MKSRVIDIFVLFYYLKIDSDKNKDNVSSFYSCSQFFLNGILVRRVIYYSIKEPRPSALCAIILQTTDFGLYLKYTQLHVFSLLKPNTTLTNYFDL